MSKGVAVESSRADSRMGIRPAITAAATADKLSPGKVHDLNFGQCLRKNR